MATAALASLPDDAVVGVLRALPMQSLAVARCVCKAWRDIVDDRALLYPYLCPRSVRGAFINYVDHNRPHHFARPTSSSTLPQVDGMLRFLPNDHRRDWWSLLDHCNGLLLCDIDWESTLCICNPATRRWTMLPPGADGKCHRYAGAYVAFDPAVSPHYEVILIPELPEKPPSPKQQDLRKERWVLPEDAPLCLDRLFSLSPDDDDIISICDEEEEFEQLPTMNDEESLEHDIVDDEPCRLMEWPPSPWMLRVFSSRTGHWEERSFVSESKPAGTVEQMRLDPEEPTFRGPRRRYAIYHHGSLYVHCRGSFVIRLSLSKGKYQIIEAPANIEYTKPYLGKLQKSVCFGIVHDNQLKIWILNEPCGKMEWVLKYEVEVGLYAKYLGAMPYGKNGRQPDGSWIVQEDNINTEYTDDGVETPLERNYEWDSDNDDIVNIEGQEYYFWSQGLNIIGFHPFKEVVFMVEWFGVVAYHLNSSKIQYLGNSRPKCYFRNHTNGIYESFVYTPCMIGELVHGDETGQSSCEEDY
ncbi:hypothetical protein U9M48_034856 [Paspalum notatum var. saurae]|uniref:F-box domain-containing protein n=1 Tax=Paspalum notatum var. saurae TaxID=547442 RepID=A0AAQ3UAT1_PASNO